MINQQPGVFPHLQSPWNIYQDTSTRLPSSERFSSPDSDFFDFLFEILVVDLVFTIFPPLSGVQESNYCSLECLDFVASPAISLISLLSHSIYPSYRYIYIVYTQHIIYHIVVLFPYPQDALQTRNTKRRASLYLL